MKNNLTRAKPIPGTRRSFAGVLGLLLALGLLLVMAFPVAVSADTPPQMPNQFWGNVTINGSPAPTSAMVYAKDGADPVTHAGGTVLMQQSVDAQGKYGYATSFMVPAAGGGNSGASQGDRIDFFVNSTWAAFALFDVGGAVNLNLAVTQVTYSLTVTSTGCDPIAVSGGVTGSVAAGTSQTYNNINTGTQVTLTAATTSCCTFAGWTVNGTPNAGTAVQGGNALQVTVTANTTVVGTGTALGPYNLTVTSTGCCSISVSGGASGTVAAGQQQVFSVACGAQVTLTAAAAAPCCGFTSWQLDGGAPSQTNPLIITMNGVHQAVANGASLTPYTVTTSVNPPGAGSVTGGGSFGCNASTTLQATANSGWKFDSWSNGITGTDNPKTINVTASISVVANFVQNQLTLPGAIMAFNLNAGWNTFSTPIKLGPTMDTWSKFISVNQLAVDVVYGFDAVNNVWIQQLDNSPVVALDGYFIKMTSAGKAQIVPSANQSAPPVKSLVSGINLVGVASLTDIKVVPYLNTVYMVQGGTGYLMVLNPPINGAGDWNTNTFIRDASPVPTAQVGKAYWVVMLNPGNLVGFTSTPLP
jgi:hypothetical protein